MICVFEVCVLETLISGGAYSLSDATLAMARLLQDLFFKSVISFRNWVKCPRQKQKQAWNKKPSLAERPLLTA